MLQAPFDNTGDEGRHSSVASGIQLELLSGSLQRPIVLDDEFLKEDGVTPDWGERDIELILQELDELEPGHGLTRADFQDSGMPTGAPDSE